MGALLKSTCDTFLKTLEECMQIANTAFTSELLHQTPPGSPNLAVLRTSKVMANIIFSEPPFVKSGICRSRERLFAHIIATGPILDILCYFLWLASEVGLLFQ